MAFRFTLAPVLQLRESLEGLLLQRLEQTQYQISRAAQSLADARSQSRTLARAREGELASGLAGAELHFQEQLQRGLQMRERGLEHELVQLHEVRKQRLAEYEDARSKRQVLADLRDRQREAYDAKLALRQQRDADDIFLARRQRG